MPGSRDQLSVSIVSKSDAGVESVVALSVDINILGDSDSSNPFAQYAQMSVEGRNLTTAVKYIKENTDSYSTALGLDILKVVPVRATCAKGILWGANIAAVIRMPTVGLEQSATTVGVTRAA